jgi:uncharacterized membrane protein
MVYSEIRREARSVMQGQWGSCVPIWLIYLLIMMVPGIIFNKASGIQLIISLAVGGPFLYSITHIFLRVNRHEAVDVGQLFEGFSDYTRTFTAYALIMLYVFLWSLLLIVPGIIAGLGYSMTFIIMAENPGIQAGEAMRQSKEMMMGYKGELFMLCLSFIGWIVISILTLGLGLLWLESYMYSSFVIFYYKIKGVKEEVMKYSSEVVAPAEETIIHTISEPAVAPEETIVHSDSEPEDNR